MIVVALGSMMAVPLPVLVWYMVRNWPGREAPIPYMAAEQSCG